MPRRHTCHERCIKCIFAAAERERRTRSPAAVALQLLMVEAAQRRPVLALPSKTLPSSAASVVPHVSQKSMQAETRLRQMGTADVYSAAEVTMASAAAPLHMTSAQTLKRCLRARDTALDASARSVARRHRESAPCLLLRLRRRLTIRRAWSRVTSRFHDPNACMQRSRRRRELTLMYEPRRAACRHNTVLQRSMHHWQARL